MYVYIRVITLYDIFILHTFILNDILLKEDKKEDINLKKLFVI